MFNAAMKKRMTLQQLERAKKRSAAALENLRDDPDGAEHVEDMSLEEFAEEKGITILENSAMRKNNGIRSGLAKVADSLSTEKFVVRAKDLDRAPVKKFKVRGRDASDALSRWKDGNDTRRYTDAKVSKNPDNNERNFMARTTTTNTTADLQARIDELEEENAGLQEELDELSEKLDNISAIAAVEDEEDDGDEEGDEDEEDEDEE
jgi:hypothetical protein